MFQEVNPAVFAIVTFPFLFGVMFGDIGHGSLLLLFGIILCLLSNKMKGGSMEAFSQIRYLVLLMGFFATFNGVIYNEFFAIPTQLFDSCYQDELTVLTNDANGTLPKEFGYYVKNPGQQCVYPVGFDSRWFQSDQLLAFSNNYKMKTAVIFAILQMSLGIIMKGFNALYFKNRLDFFFEFIPQIVLLLALFGWMDTLIIGKWNMEKNINTVIDVSASDPSTLAEFNKVHLSPAIITTMIDIFLAFGNNKNADGSIKYNYVFPSSQQSMSILFLVISFICVPLMLAVKPMVLKRQLEHEHHHHHDNDVLIRVE
jgi:V-type H+-transporting ATPase subunit a